LGGRPNKALGSSRDWPRAGEGAEAEGEGTVVSGRAEYPGAAYGEGARLPTPVMPMGGTAGSATGPGTAALLVAGGWLP